MKRKRGLPKEIKSWIVIAFLFNLLPATKAQTSLSTDSTDFNGAIPPSCVVDIPESSYPMSYNSSDNRFNKSVSFTLTSNTSVNISLAQVSVIQEPAGIPNRDAYVRLWRPVAPGSNDLTTTNPGHPTTATPSSAGTSMSANNTPGASTTYSLNFVLKTEEKDQNQRYYLLPGNYEYQVTVNCLQ